MLLPPLLLTAFMLPAAAPSAPSHVLETTDAGRIEATLTLTVRCDSFQAREWIVFAADAPELPGQTRVSSKLWPGGSRARDLSPLGRRVLMARVPVKDRELAAGIPIRVVYEATLRQRKLRPLAAGETPPRVQPLSDKERAAALAAHGVIDHRREAFREWLKESKLLRGKEETDMAFAYRVFQAIRGRYRYDYQRDMDRRASAVCKVDATDCGGLAVLFVAALRANHVPARVLQGRWATSADKTRLNGIPYYQTHVKAEFFAEGVGWVPVDLGTAVGPGRTQEGSRSFGNDRGDFLALHVDTDVEVDTVRFGKKTVLGLQVPLYWGYGKGSLEFATLTEDWQVRRLP